jgi:hypothetical protein
MFLGTTTLYISTRKDKTHTHPRVANKAWISDDTHVRMKFWQHNPTVVQLHAWQWCNKEQQGYDAKISFWLMDHHKYHALSPTLRLSKEGTISDLHISHACHMWGMSNWNGWCIGFVTIGVLWLRRPCRTKPQPCGPRRSLNGPTLVPNELRLGGYGHQEASMRNRLHYVSLATTHSQPAKWWPPGHTFLRILLHAILQYTHSTIGFHF